MGELSEDRASRVSFPANSLLFCGSRLVVTAKAYGRERSIMKKTSTVAGITIPGRKRCRDTVLTPWGLPSLQVYLRQHFELDNCSVHSYVPTRCK
jgi:hypothetical protein